MSELHLPIPKIETAKRPAEAKPKIGETELQGLYNKSNDLVTQEHKTFSLSDLLTNLPEAQPADTATKQVTKGEIKKADELLKTINGEIADITEAQKQIKFCEAAIKEYGDDLTKDETALPRFDLEALSAVKQGPDGKYQALPLLSALRANRASFQGKDNQPWTRENDAIYKNQTARAYFQREKEAGRQYSRIKANLIVSLERRIGRSLTMEELPQLDEVTRRIEDLAKRSRLSQTQDSNKDHLPWADQNVDHALFVEVCLNQMRVPDKNPPNQAAEITKKMPVTKGGLIIDRDGNFTGKFYYKDEKGELKDGKLHVAGNIATLRRLAASEDQLADAIYKTLKDNDTVLATFGDKTPITLAALDKEIQKRAEELWAQQHKDTPFPTLEAQSPLIAHAYRVMAEKELAPAGVTYSFQHKEVTEVPPVLEAEKRAENVLTARKIMLKRHFEKAYQSEKEGKKAEYDPDAAEITYWGDYLDKVIRDEIKVPDKEKAVAALTTILTRAERFYLNKNINKYSELQDPNIVNLIAGNESFYNQNLIDNDPLSKLLINQCDALSSYGMRAEMLGIEKSNSRYIVVDNPEVNIARILKFIRILQPAAASDAGRYPGDRESFVRNIITMSTNFGNLNGAEAFFLNQLNEFKQLQPVHDSINGALSLPKEKIEKPDDVQKHMKGNLDGVIKSVYGEEPVEEKKKTAIEHTLLPPVNLNKLLSGEEGGLGGVIAALIIIQLSAGLLEFGGDTEPQGPSHP